MVGILPETLRARISYVLIFMLVVILLIICCLVANSNRTLSSDHIAAITATYSELIQQDDFVSLRSKDELLLLQRTHSDEHIILSYDEFSNTAAVFHATGVEYIMKRGNDVYFVTEGLLDNVSGYVLSEDLLIDMTEIMKIERVLVPCPYKIFYFSTEK